MYFSIRSFILYTCILSVNCFLLDSGNTVRPGENQKCLSVESFVAEKKELKHEIDILKRDMEQTLQVLTSQLNRKLNALENENCTSNNDILLLAEKWEERYEELGNNNTKLKAEYNLLQKQYIKQESEVISLRKEVSDLNQLKNVQHFRDVKSIQLEIEILQKNAALLSSNQNARNEDFLALYNVTVQQHHYLNLVQQNLHSLQQTTNVLTNNQNVRKQDFIALFNRTISSERNIEDLKIKMTDSFQTYTKSQNFTFADVYSHIRILDNKAADNSKKVALSACGNDADLSIIAGGILKFQQIRTKIGINNIASFSSTGKFTCESAGLYYISAYIRSDTDSFTYFIMKNDVAILKSAGTAHVDTLHSTSPIVASVEVQKNDTLYIKIAASSRIFGAYSCITIIRVK